MSLLNSASLVVTPNGYKEGTLYSVIPNTSLGDMTVVRATTATRVNSAGLIELVPYNLVTYSEQFNNAAWTKARGSVTANATIAPNGTTTADKFVPDTQVNPHFVSQNASNLSVGGVYTSSVYAKISEWNSAAIFRSDSAVGVSFRLDTQVATVVIGSPISYSITSVGNGWFRLDVCFTAASASNGLQVRVGNNSSYSLAGNNSDGLFLWGAQLVEGTLPKDYLRTETRLNIPRLDYSNGSCPSLLVEPQRTNLMTYSEQFDNAAWNNVRGVVTPNTTISPDGTQNADTFVSAAGQAFFPALTRAPSFVGNTNYSFSVFAKVLGNTNILRLSYVDNSIGYTGGKASYNLATQVVTITQSPNASVTASMQSVGNGWYRLVLNFLTIATPTYNYSSIDITTNDVANAFALYGAQLEQATYPTSYIPTTSAAVTRNADLISKTGISSLIGQTEGVIFADFVWEGSTTGAADYPLLVYGSSYGNFVALSTFNNTNAMYVYVGGTNVVAINGTTFVNGQRYKIAMAYKLNDFVYYLNGTQMGTDTSAGVPSSMANLRTDTPYGGKSTSQKYNSVIFFPTRLTNAELALLTT